MQHSKFKDPFFQETDEHLDRAALAHDPGRKRPTDSRPNAVKEALIRDASTQNRHC